MSIDWYSYSIQLQRYLEAQDKRILKLEQEITRLSEEILSVKNKPPIHVDRIEYKFDQLKVESLDGTLNIGLNPNDLNNIDEFSINKQPASPTTFPFPDREKMVNEMAEELMKDLDDMIQETEEQVGISLNPSYHEFIRNDVARQLEQRIMMYFDNSSTMERSQQPFELLKENIYQKVKSDIQVALTNFIIHSKGETGGHNTNGT